MSHRTALIVSLFRFSIILSVIIPLPLFAVELPASVDAARVTQTLNAPVPPKTYGGTIIPGFTPQSPSAEAQRAQFKLNRLIITGSTVYGNAALETLFQGYLGHTISLAELQQISDNITLKYRQDGYILSKAIVPAQSIKNGVATIRVIEGYVNRVTIVGDPKGARKLLEEYGEQIEKVRPLNLATLERYALLADDIPGLNVKTVLSAAQAPINVMAPSTIFPGAANLTFVTDQRIASGYLAYDNRGTRYLGPQEYTLSGIVNSIFRSGDQINLQALLTADSKELRYINLNTQQPIGNNGMQLNLAGGYSRSEPGYLLEPLGVVGVGRSFSAGLTYPILRTRNQSLFLNGKFDYLNNKTDLDTFSSTLFNDHIRSVRFGALYNRNDQWLGINQLGGQISQGLKILGASNDNSATLSRPNGRSDYTKVNFNASRLQGLGHNFSLLTTTQGQYAFTPLLSAEQFGYGGANFGVAYDPSEITGDHGIDAKAELRYDMRPDWRALRGIQYYAFYDIGKIWNRTVTAGQVSSASGASTGLGFRANFTNYFAGNLVLAKPLTRTPAAEDSRGVRVFFGVSLSGDAPASWGSHNFNPPSTPAIANTVRSYSGLAMSSQQLLPIAQPAPQPAPVAPTPAPATQPVIQHPAFTTKVPQNYEGLTPLITDEQPVENNSVTLEKAPAIVHHEIGQGYYTLQFSSGRNLDALEKQGHAFGGQVQYLVMDKNGENWYLLTSGHYTTSQAAEQALAQWAGSTRPKPWIRYISPHIKTVE